MSRPLGGFISSAVLLILNPCPQKGSRVTFTIGDRGTEAQLPSAHTQTIPQIAQDVGGFFPEPSWLNLPTSSHSFPLPTCLPSISTGQCPFQINRAAFQHGAQDALPCTTGAGHGLQVPWRTVATAVATAGHGKYPPSRMSIGHSWCW